eukprot:10971510-Alexandrium_andersonii.AAC.1
MSASLVGSEMCIRDRDSSMRLQPHAGPSHLLSLLGQLVSTSRTQGRVLLGLKASNLSSACRVGVWHRRAMFWCAWQECKGVPGSPHIPRGMPEANNERAQPTRDMADVRVSRIMCA